MPVQDPSAVGGKSVGVDEVALSRAALNSDHGAYP